MFWKRILGTPNEEIWPSVSSLPDYKPTFPQWSRQDVARIVTTLDEAGIDMLKVRDLSNPPYFFIIFCLRFLAYPYVWFCQTSFWCVSLLFLDKVLSFLLIFKQNEHLRIPTSLIIDLKKFSNINTKRPRRVPIQFDIISIHLSVPSMLVMFVLFLRFCEVLFTWTCAWLFTIFYLFISSSRIPNLKKKKDRNN